MGKKSQGRTAATASERIVERSTKGPWPYRMELNEAAARAEAEAIGHHVSGASPLPKSFRLRRAGEDIVVYCFARADQAELFQLRFGGKAAAPRPGAN